MAIALQLQIDGKGIAVSLFKYMKFDDLTRILDGNVRFTQPRAFNDPFEMAPELYVPGNFGTKDTPLTFSVVAPRRRPSVGELDDGFESEDLNDINSRRILSSLNEAIGILCLSRNGSSLLMWAHYADSYSGAIVEFDESHEFFAGHFEVEYRKRRPKKDVMSYLTGREPIPISELCVKSKEWEYEAEVRVVRSLSNCRRVGRVCEHPVFVMDFAPECVKSVILGERMPHSRQREIWEKVQNRDGLSLYLDAISNWGFDFRREMIKLAGLKNPIVSPRTAHIFAQEEGTYGAIARWLLKKHPLRAVMNDTL